MRFGVLPQSLPGVLSYGLLRFALPIGLVGTEPAWVNEAIAAVAAATRTITTITVSRPEPRRRFSGDRGCFVLMVFMASFSPTFPYYAETFPQKPTK